MSRVFCDSVIHNNNNNNNSNNNDNNIIYSDRTWVFDQSELAQGPIYIIMI